MEAIQVYRPHHTMRELIIDNNMILMAISRFDIAFGFGDSSVAETCRDNVHTDTFIAVCNLLSGKDFCSDSISLSSLTGYLRRAHSYFLDFALPKIRHNLIDAINYSDTDEVAFQLIRFFDDYVKEVTRHMSYENDFIFAYVDKLLGGEISEDFNIARFSTSHGHMATKLQELKDIFIYHYKRHDNSRLGAVLFDIITCERDFMSHFEVEKQLLIPAISRREDTLRSRLLDTDSDEASGNEPDEDPQLALLSERERDILKCVARGMANKEIADHLCLSVHTVTTHRRNICSKLSIHSPAGLTIFAILHHLVDLGGRAVIIR